MKLLLLFLMSLFLFPPAAGLTAQNRASLDPSKELSHFARRSWEKKQGLPQNSVQAMAQSRDGYLWFGTQEGLARFDGLRFRVFSPRNVKALKKKFITALLERPDGSLLIGTHAGGITLLKGDTWSHYPIAEEEETVNHLFEDSRGRTWAATSGGLSLFKDSVFTPFVRGLYVHTIAEDADGNVLLGTARGLFVVNDREVQPLSIPGLTHARITSSSRAPDGSLWLGTNGSGVVHLNNSVVRKFTIDDGLPSNVVTEVFADKSGSVWVGVAGSGLCRIRGNKVSTHGEMFSGEHIHSLMEDSEGSLWIGTGGGGVHRLSNAPFTTFESGRTTSQRMVRAVTSDRNGTVWAGNEAGELLRWDGRRFAPSLKFPLKGGHQIRALAEDRTGTLWIGLNTGLYAYERGKLSQHFPTHSSVSALYIDSRNVVWVGTGAGILKIQANKGARKVSGRMLEGTAVRYFREDSKGGMWISAASGLYYYFNNALKHFTTKDGLRSNQTYAVHLDHEGTVWVGSAGGGLSRIKDGRISTVGMDEGLYDDNVYEILEDDKQNLWMSSNNGVFRIRKADFDSVSGSEVKMLTSQSFGESEGIVSAECNGGTQPAAHKTPDGRLWFVTLAGVAMVDPNNLSAAMPPPPVAIERFLAGDRELMVSEGVSVPPDRRDIQIDFTALTFLSPEKVRFRYMLEGYYDGWIDVGSRRSAYYSNLDPGTYRFRVSAANEYGPWAENEASVTFELEPYVHETAWFLTLCLVALLAVLGRGFQLYKRYQQRKLVSSELETQLSRSQLQALRLQLQPHFLFNTLNAISGTILVSRSKGIKMIARLSEILRHSLETEASQTLPLRREMNLLKLYLDLEKERFGERLSIKIEVAKETLDASVPSFILQPLVENAINHGISENLRGGTIRIKSRRIGTQLELTVTDNGSNGGNGKTGHLRGGIGLSNTRNRLNHLYGSSFDFALTPNDTGGMTSRIVIPFETNGSLKS